MLKKIFKLIAGIFLVLIAIPTLIWLTSKFYSQVMKPPADFLYMTDKVGEHSISLNNYKDLADDCSFNEYDRSQPIGVNLTKIEIFQEKKASNDSDGFIFPTLARESTCPKLSDVNFYIYNHKTGTSQQINIDQVNKLRIGYQYQKGTKFYNLGYENYKGFVVNMINSHTYISPEERGKTCYEGCGSTIDDPGSFSLQRFYSQKKIDVLTNEQKQDKTHVEFVGWIK